MMTELSRDSLDQDDSTLIFEARRGTVRIHGQRVAHLLKRCSVERRQWDQGAAATRPTVRTSSHAFAVAALAQGTITGASVVPQISGVTGALPTAAGAFAPTAFAAGAIAPLPQLHRSA